MLRLIAVFFTILAFCINAQTTTIFSDDFNDLNNWTLYGNPLPNWVNSVYGKNGVFDNNGDPNYNSGAISKQQFDISKGFVIESEVYLDFSNLSGCWAGASIGIADPNYKSWGGYDAYIHLDLHAEGDACWATPSELRRRVLITGGFRNGPGVSDWENLGDPNSKPIFGDQYSNGWHILKINVDQNGFPKFYIDNDLIYEGKTSVEKSILNTPSALWLGDRSSGYAGKAYHDWIKLSDPDVVSYSDVNALMQDAVFILKVQTNSTIDINSLLGSNSVYKKTSDNNYVYWETVLNDYNRCDDPTYNGISGISTSVIVKIAVSNNGTFHIGTFGSNLEEHLTVFTGQYNGFPNYTDFNDNLLDISVYKSPKEYPISNDLKQNRLGFIFRKEYIRLKGEGRITGGPENSADLYNCNFFLKNNTSQKVVALKSFLIHQQMDYSWFNELSRPYCTKQNELWSPISKNRDQNCSLSRSFNISYNNAHYSSVLIETSTDNGMWGKTLITGMNNPPDYTSSGGDSRNWAITYDSGNKTYKVENNNCASAAVELRNQFPTSVNMSGYTQWSGFYQYITMAIFGEDIITTDHQESPSPGDDNNPVPMKLIIQPGWNSEEQAGNSLIAYYPFNENANDESGNGYNGTINGPALTTDRFGNNNKAFTFDGVNDYITSNINSTFTEMAISLWVNSSSPSTNDNKDHGVILFNNQLGMGWGYIEDFYYYRPDDKVPVLTCSNYLDYNCFYKVKVNLWHHVVLMYTKAGVKMYVDNQKVLENSEIIPITTGLLEIGKGNFPAITYMKGKIDDIRIYNRELSPAEIQELYHEGGWIGNETGFLITATSGEGGAISPSGNVTVNSGSNQTFTINANTGYHISDVIVDSKSVGAVSTYTFENVTSDHTISASFALDEKPKVLPVPIAVSPIGGVLVYSLTPTLYWKTETTSEGLSFKLKYSTDTANSNVNGDLKIVDAGNELQLTLAQLQWNKTYYWQVQSTDGVNSSDYSTIATFKTVEQNVVVNPEVPVPAWPIGGATVYLSSQYLTWYLQSGWSNISSFTLKWGESGGSLDNVVDGITNITYPITGLLPGHTYSWTVESVDKQGHHSLPSEVQTFSTAGGTANKPYTPVQAWPIGGATVYVTSPTLSWYMIQPGFGIKEYMIRYSKNPDMSGAVEIHQNGYINVLTLTGLEKGMTYYWQVQSYDGHVYSDPQIPPASFTVYSDNYAAVPFALSPSGGIGISSSSIQLSWALSTDKAQSYILQYSTDKNFNQSFEIKDIKTNSINVSDLRSPVYFWRVQSKTKDGVLSPYSTVGKFTVKSIVSLAEKGLNPEDFILFQNYPNPFNPSTSIVFNLPNESDVTVEVFNAIGKTVAQVYKGIKPKGLTTMEFNAEELPSGIYFFKIEAVDINGKLNYAVKKMLLLK